MAGTSKSDHMVANTRTSIHRRSLHDPIGRLSWDPSHHLQMWAYIARSGFPFGQSTAGKAAGDLVTDRSDFRELASRLDCGRDKGLSFCIKVWPRIISSLAYKAGELAARGIVASQQPGDLAWRYPDWVRAWGAPGWDGSRVPPSQPGSTQRAAPPLNVTISGTASGEDDDGDDGGHSPVLQSPRAAPAGNHRHPPAPNSQQPLPAQQHPQNFSQHSAPRAPPPAPPSRHEGEEEESAVLASGTTPASHAAQRQQLRPTNDPQPGLSASRFAVSSAKAPAAAQETATTRQPGSSSQAHQPQQSVPRSPALNNDPPTPTPAADLAMVAALQLRLNEMERRMAEQEEHIQASRLTDMSAAPLAAGGSSTCAGDTSLNRQTTLPVHLQDTTPAAQKVQFQATVSDEHEEADYTTTTIGGNVIQQELDPSSGIRHTSEQRQAQQHHHRQPHISTDLDQNMLSEEKRPGMTPQATPRRHSLHDCADPGLLTPPPTVRHPKRLGGTRVSFDASSRPTMSLVDDCDGTVPFTPIIARGPKGSYRQRNRAHDHSGRRSPTPQSRSQRRIPPPPSPSAAAATGRGNAELLPHGTGLMTPRSDGRREKPAELRTRFNESHRPILSSAVNPVLTSTKSHQHDRKDESRRNNTNGNNPGELQGFFAPTTPPNQLSLNSPKPRPSPPQSFPSRTERRQRQRTREPTSAERYGVELQKEKDLIETELRCVAVAALEASSRLCAAEMRFQLQLQTLTTAPAAASAMDILRRLDHDSGRGGREAATGGRRQHPQEQQYRVFDAWAAAVRRLGWLECVWAMRHGGVCGGGDVSLVAFLLEEWWPVTSITTTRRKKELRQG